MNVQSKKFLLVGGLGPTDLSGKVPRPGLLMLRRALRQAGHEAVIDNYATTLMGKLYPLNLVKRLTTIYQRSIKPLVIEGKNPLLPPWRSLKLFYDLRQLKLITKELSIIEKEVYGKLGQELVERIKTERFDAVGFSLFLGGSTVGSIIMANTLRAADPTLPIIFGGPQTSHLAETIYQETNAPTALVRGEGEQAIVGIAGIIDQLKAGQLSNLNQIPNVIFKDQQGQIIATTRQRLALDDWVKLSSAPYEEADLQGLMRYAFIETSRGCPWGCNFCSQPLLSGKIRYLKPAARIVDEMVELNQKYGLTNFEMVGSSTPPSQAEAIAEALIARGLAGKFNWVAFMRGKDERARESDPAKLMDKLKKTGAAALFFGVEAADNETLRLMGKKETIEEIKTMMLAARQAGIATIGSFIYPYPGMPANEAALIMDFIRETKPLSAPVQALGLYPGTESADRAADIGCEIVYPEAADRRLARQGKKPPATMASPEVLRYLLTYPLILSLPMRLWPALPWKIDGKDYAEYVKDVNRLQKRVNQLGILTGFSHSHYLIARVLGLAPQVLAEKMFYLSLTGDPAATSEAIENFNSQSRK